MSGQVCVWDARASPAPVACSAPHEAHQDLVRSVLFISSKAGTEFFSGGADGVLKWWDTRNMDRPTDVLILDLVKSVNERQSISNANSVSTLEYEPTIPTRFMVGTENGSVVMGNRKGKNILEKLPGKYTAHAGPVYRVERNPGSLKNFLSVGTWQASVWSEEVREAAVLWTGPQRRALADGAWSPARGSLALLARADGSLAAWDLLRRHHAPVLSVQVCRRPLLRVRLHSAGKVLLCGSSDGNIYMQELSESLRDSDKQEKGLLTQVLERETKRERILDSRLRELRLRQRQTGERSASASSRSSAASLAAAADLPDRELADLSAAYLAAVRTHLAAFTPHTPHTPAPHTA
ncbi:dynein intermediate chain 3, ciliary-like [Anticarsia gemmatalis]|uniref:dynein intermediate chain 3, ciliary-like n=1 Tax=Anticarsia gemmatalis TaxID=129554 RepID=UPI003F75B8F1